MKFTEKGRIPSSFETFWKLLCEIRLWWTGTSSPNIWESELWNTRQKHETEYEEEVMAVKYCDFKNYLVFVCWYPTVDKAGIDLQIDL